MPEILEIIDIQNAADFQARVIEGVKTKTFVVDFWAPWCAPCQSLAPVLECSVAPFGDKAALVKVNIDDIPELAEAFGIAGIPAVKIFREGRIVGEFAGAQPETVVRKLIAEWIPSQVDDMVAQAESLLEEGKTAKAESLLDDAIAASPGHGRASVLLAEIWLEKGDIEGAEQLASGVTMESLDYAQAQGILARIGYQRVCREAGGRSAAAVRLAAEPDDLDARHALACCMAADGDYEQALENLLQSVRRDRDHEDGAARKAMLNIFDLLGRDDPVAEEYRRKLSRVLFS